tara:strand:- start:47 stop:292 length:246 start_codon:yes stop_codon:yes gene_type:complete
MLKVLCKECNKELISNTKPQACGCSNNMVVCEDKISAVDLSNVLIINSYEVPKEPTLSSEDIAWQQSRKKRKVRKLDFEVR